MIIIIVNSVTLATSWQPTHRVFIRVLSFLSRSYRNFGVYHKWCIISVTVVVRVLKRGDAIRTVNIKSRKTLSGNSSVVYVCQPVAARVSGWQREMLSCDRLEPERGRALLAIDVEVPAKQRKFFIRHDVPYDACFLCCRKAGFAGFRGWHGWENSEYVDDIDKWELSIAYPSMKEFRLRHIFLIYLSLTRLPSLIL